MSGKWKRYPAYRESGIGWLGRIPEGWGLLKLKHSARFQGGGTPSKDDPRYWNGDIPWVSPKDMKQEVVADSEDHITPAAIRASATRLIPEGAVLIVVRSGILKHSIPVAINSRPVALNQDMKAILPVSPLTTRYLAWLINGLQATFLLEWRKAGATVESLEHELVASTPTPCPSRSEQQAIAAFLDRETAKIDALVAKKERLIEFLQEKRTALISHAVTRGLNPNAPLRDSGIPWIGSIPEHWATKQLKHLVLSRPGAIKTGPFGSQLLASEMAEGTVKVLNQRNVIDRDLTTGDNYISEAKFSDLRAFEVFGGDLLLTTRGTIGRCAIVPMASERAILHPCLMRVQLHPARLRPDFLCALIEDSGLVLKQLQLLSNATTIEVIYSETLRRVSIPVPPVEEQDRIVVHIRLETAKLDALIIKISTAIDRLQEYRTALISAAVTGQIDVRGEGRTA